MAGSQTDISQRKGSVKLPLPAILGSEGAGTLENGERVAYSMVRGSYAEYAAVPEKMLVRLPDDIDFRTAAAVMLQGMTAHYLTHSTFPLKKGDKALVHAAAIVRDLNFKYLKQGKGAPVQMASHFHFATRKNWNS